MKRVEVIFSQAVEDDFIEQLALKNVNKYTIIPEARGAGFSNPKLGNDIWPQLNSMALLFCNDEECEKVIATVKELRARYVTEGIACFVSSAEEF